MTDKPDMPEQTGPNPKSPKGCRTDGTVALLGLGGMLILVVGAVVIHETRFDEGELVLTEQGCKALAAHEAQIEPLDDNGLCRAVVEFQFSNRTERFGTVRVHTPRGRIEVELPGSTVVSKAIH